MWVLWVLALALWLTASVGLCLFIAGAVRLRDDRREK